MWGLRGAEEEAGGEDLREGEVEEEEVTLLQLSPLLREKARCSLACTLLTALWMYLNRSFTPTSLTLFPPSFINVNVRIGFCFILS